MKKTILLSVLLFSGNIVQAQDYFGDILPVYSTSDMNLKGKIKKITETTAYLDSRGRAEEEELQEKIVYEFDKTGNLIKVEYADSDGASNTSEYYYSNGQINKIISYVKYSGTSTTLVTFDPNTITYRTDGKLATVFNGSGKKILERKKFTTSEKDYWARNTYEYNSDGKIMKDTYDNGDKYSYYSTYRLYFYDKTGNISKKEDYESSGTKKDTTDYTYTYDKNKNWTKIIEESYSPGDDKEDHLYKQRIRTYEFY